MRSEDMNLYKLIMSKDQEYFITDIIGQCEMAHYININEEEQAFKLPYAEMVRRCDESERQVSFILQQCQNYNIELSPVESVSMLSEVAKELAKERQVSVETLFNSIERDVGEIDNFIKQQTEGSRQMKEESNHLIEYYTVLKKAG